MSDLKYKVIKSDDQYRDYSEELERLVFSDDSEKHMDEIELLTLLIDGRDAK